MSDYRGLLKHSGNYLFAIIATKALAFFSLPVYTYLMTVEEYGVYNLFISVVGIATILLPLNTNIALSRYYYDRKNEEDFRNFVGATVKLTSILFFIMSALLVIFVTPFSEYFGLEKLLTLSIIPVALYNIINGIFQQIYQPMMQSRKIAVVSSIQAYLAFGLSVLFILFIDKKKYYGQVYGTIVAMVILSSYLIHQIKAYYNNSFERSHIKYILSYALPYLPYSLSGLIIAQFGKLILGQQAGFESVGLYSFSSNIAMLMLVYIMLIHEAWNPYYFRYLNAKDYRSVDNDYDLIWRITLIIALGLSVFSYEIGFLLGSNDYTESLYLIPILTLGYCFYQWSYVYMRNFGFAKKTIWNAFVVMISGIVNIALNSILLKYLGVLGVALSFSFSYIILLVASYLVNKHILKVHAPKLQLFIKPFIVFLPFWCLSIYLTFVHGILFLLIKACVLLIMTILLALPYKNKVSVLLRKKYKC